MLKIERQNQVRKPQKDFLLWKNLCIEYRKNPLPGTFFVTENVLFNILHTAKQYNLIKISSTRMCCKIRSIIIECQPVVTHFCA